MLWAVKNSIKNKLTTAITYWLHHPGFETQYWFSSLFVTMQVVHHYEEHPTTYAQISFIVQFFFFDKIFSVIEPSLFRCTTVCSEVLIYYEHRGLRMIDYELNLGFEIIGV